MKLPEQFLTAMHALMGDEYEPWLASYDQKPYQGLRVNTTKILPEEWEKISPYPMTPVSWTQNGFYLSEQERPAKDSYYYAGLYYLQEPSAMAPAAVLPIEPGDAVLDLCAAPGGKSTELGARLQGQGLLVSNDISNSRARALLKNLELFGISNLCVTSETPQKLADTFGVFFDKILVDAPCSGEGMFRRDPDLIKSWLEHGPDYYAPIQREILFQASRMLKPGGLLLYSTCTFAREEDEETIDWILQNAPELELVPVAPWEGACGGADGKPVIRLFPHRIAGEGHFLALLQKRGEAESVESVASARSAAVQQAVDAPDRKQMEQLRLLEQESDFKAWEAMLTTTFDRKRMMIREGQVYYLPVQFERRWNLRYLRTGLLLGEWKKTRFEPSQVVAMTLRENDFSQTLNLAHEDERVVRYLKGETLFLNDGEALQKGWVLVCVEHHPLGWAKYTGSSLKNKYYPGWRWQ
ncbi:MAG: RsmB/NOP family class I SAM-dependent RNA methyltransferase [Lachnospiraceae bacterium]|nr:RsmB/NOP family class I SAM-dependent RNA methyltransferase [Lachnospiraceae bacterium]